MAQELYDLPKGWEWKSLEELGKFAGGGTPLKSNPDFWNGDILWITPKDMKAESLADSELKITEKAVKKSSARMLPANSVLIVGRSGILKHTLPVCINLSEATVNQDIKAFIPSVAITPRFCQYMLKGFQGYILNELVKGGVTVQSLKFQEFKAHKFPVPPLAEQERIVGRLDALFSRIDQTIAQLKHTQAQTQALWASALDAAIENAATAVDHKPFGEIVDNFDGKRIPIKSSERKTTKGTYPYYGATGIIDYVDDYIFSEERLLISEDGANLVARKYPIAFRASGKYWVNNHAHVVSANSEISTNRFLEFWFSWIDLSKYITGSAQPKLSQGKLNTIPFPLIPLPEQAKIVTQLEALSERTQALAATTTRQLDQLTALKASLLDAALRGQL